MSNKKAELDILGESYIPEDLLTNSLGSSYGLDTDPDIGIGMGTLEGILDPTFLEAPALPTGLTRSGAGEGMDLTALVEESLADLSWLDPTQLQDLDRLPHNPVDTMIPELVEAWGVNRRTEGIEVVAQDLTRARYEEGLSKTGPVRKATAKQIRTVVRQAMRRSAAGQDIGTVIREAMESMGEEMDRVAPFLRVVQADHGLAGNVFIRASAYPSYGGGKWSKIVKRHASGARYVIVSERELKTATWIVDGRCQYTGKHAVTEIPWKEAFDHYRGRIAADRLTLNGPHLEGPNRAARCRAALRVAFLTPQERKAVNTLFPSHDPTKRERYEAPKQALHDPRVERAAREATEVEAKIEKLVANGMLPLVDRDRILASGVPPFEKLRVAAGLASLPKTSRFSGVPNQAHAVNRQLYLQRLETGAHRSRERGAALAKEARARAEAAVRLMCDRGLFSEGTRNCLLLAAQAPHDMLRAASRLALIKRSDYSGTVNCAAAREEDRTWARLARVSDKVAEARTALAERTVQEKKARVAVSVSRIEAAIRRGARGQILKSIIRRAFVEEDVRAGIKILTPILQKTGALKDPEPAAEYQGDEYKAHTLNRISTLEAPSKSSRVASALGWIRRSMSEGFAGPDLDSLISHRFSSKVLQAAASDIKAARLQHEGGAGFIYVDAEAYASPTGIKGCEKGGLRHRANTIPAVAEMERCATCTLVRTLEDGSRKCGVYNKLLLEDTQDPELQDLKLANLRVANMHDAEQTQAMFMVPENVYSPGEFSLRNSNLEDLNLSAEPEFAELDISFGGWDF